MEILSSCKRLGSWWLFFRYTCAGVTAVVVQYMALSCLVECLDSSPTASSGISYVLACVVNYLMLYAWVFKAGGKHHVTALRYAIVTTLTLGINLLIFHALLTRLALWYIWAQGIATSSVSLINFSVNRKYTFV